MIGGRIKGKIFDLLMASQDFLGGTINLPCIGSVPGGTLRGTLANLRFQVTSKNYGPNRAGTNLSKSGVSSIPVEVNQTALKGYAALDGDGGLLYLIAHEFAHAQKALRDYNQANFRAFQNGAGKGMSVPQARSAFEFTAEFAENEARANKIAQEILRLLNRGSFNFPPPYGFSTSC